MKRINYYGENFITSGNNVNNILEIKKEINLERDYSAMEIISLYNASKYLNNIVESNINNEVITPILVDECQKLKTTINIILGKFSSKISNDTIFDFIKNLEYDQFNDFLNFIDYYKVFKNISSDIFSKMLNDNESRISCFLENLKTVQYFDNELKIFLLANKNSGYYLLEEYAIKHIVERKKFYFPKSLTLEEKEKMIDNYINFNKCNFNYLEIIVNCGTTSDLRISDRVKLRAKRKLEKEKADFFKENRGMRIGVSSNFKKMKDIVKIESKDYLTYFTYNLDWITENLDNATMLNNFIFLFEFVDSQRRINFISRYSEDGLYERVLTTSGKRYYNTNFSFKYREMVSDVQFLSYYATLEKNGVHLEDIIFWFFNNYLKDEFGIKNFKMVVPNHSYDYLAKCKYIAAEFERCIKLYNIFVEDGYIDLDLLCMSTNSLPIENIKSLLNNKYVTTRNDKLFSRLSHYLFSDQCMLLYTLKIEKKYNNLAILFTEENINVKDVPEIDKYVVDDLLENKILKLNDNGFLEICKNKLNIIHDIYLNGSLNMYKQTVVNKEIIEELIKSELLEYENGLFTGSEIDYFNYYLNNKSFDNSLGIRNMYYHGSDPIEKEHVHKSNYMIFLKLFILLIIKINDDLCLYKKEE